jgi:hypothetical protein
MVESSGKGTQTQNKELYQHILGLSTLWQVIDVNLDTSAEEIRVQTDHSR